MEEITKELIKIQEKRKVKETIILGSRNLFDEDGRITIPEKNES